MSYVAVLGIEVVGTYNVDNVVPTAPTITNSSGGNWTNQNVTIKASSTDSTSGVSKFQFSYDNSTWSDWTDGSMTTSGTTTTRSDTWTAERNNTLYIRAVDVAGNTSSSSNTKVKIDKTKPTMTSITNPTNGNWVNYSFKLTVKAYDAASGIAGFEYSYDNSTWKTDWDASPSAVSGETGYYSTTGTYSAERNSTCYVRAKDAAGNYSSNTLTTTIRIDKTAPVPTATLYVDPYVYTDNGGPYVNTSAVTGIVYDDGGLNDALSGVKGIRFYFYNGAMDWIEGTTNSLSETDLEVSSGQYNWTFNFADAPNMETGTTNNGDGIYVMHYHLLDNANNYKWGGALWISLDTTSPTITASKTSNDWTNSAVSITLTAADPTVNDVTSGITTGNAADNTYEYFLSTDTAPTTAPTLTTYTSGTEFSINPGTSGQYYLYVKTIKDGVGNTSTASGSTTVTIGSDTYHRFGPYKFDYDKPTGTTDASVTVTNHKAVTNQPTITIYLKNVVDIGGSGIDYVTIGGWYGTSWVAQNSVGTVSYDSTNDWYYATFTFSEIPDTTTGATNNGEGTYTFGGNIYDKAGNVTNLSSTDWINVTYDITAPVISVQTEMTTDGLIRNYHAGNNTGSGHSHLVSTWTDLSGNQDGTITGATIYDEYLSFDGTDDWVNAGEISVTDEVTLEVNLELNSIQSGTANIMSNYNTGGVGLSIVNGILRMQAYDADSATYIKATDDTVLSAGQLYNIIGTFDGSTVKLYLDGQLIAETAFSGTYGGPNNSTVMGIGADPNGTETDGEFVDMKLYSARIYNKALSEDEIALNSNTKWAKSHSATVTISDCLSGLATGASIKYGWSTSKTTAPSNYTTVTLPTYSSGDKSITFTAEGSGITGQYYLWVVPTTLKDVATNSQTSTKYSTHTLPFDNTNPTITVSQTLCDWRNTALDVTITAADGHSGLASSTAYEYYLSTSSSGLSGGSWKTYTNGGIVSLNPGTSGKYYLYIKAVTDKVGNVSDTDGTISIINSATYHRFGEYKFDYEAPIWKKQSVTMDLPNSKATVTILGTDELSGYASNSLDESDIAIYVNGEIDTSGITLSLGSATTVADGIQYTITVEGFSASNSQLKLVIATNTLTDNAGNVNEETELRLYNVLKSASAEDGFASGFLGNTNIKREDIEKVIFMQSVDDSTGAQQVWDVSEQGDDSILAWYNETSAPYTVYIGSDDLMFANKDSSNLFAYIGYGSSSTATTVIENLSLLNTGCVTNMSSMFEFCGYRTMTTLDLSSLNTASVTNMREMFMGTGYKAMTTFTLGTSFNTSNVTDMSWMFANWGYTAMTTLTLPSTFTTTNVTDMSYMFMGTGYTALTSLNLSTFNTSKVKDMSYMFSNCGYTALTSLDLSTFNTSEVTDMSYMFNYCGYTAMASLNLGENFDTSSVTDMGLMFAWCGYTALTSLDLGDKFDTSNATDMGVMFYYCGYTALTSLDLGPAFTHINGYDQGFIEGCGDTKNATIYAPEAIYFNRELFKTSSTDTGEDVQQLNHYATNGGIIVAKYKPEWIVTGTSVDTSNKTMTIDLLGEINYTAELTGTNLTTNHISFYIDGTELTEIGKSISGQGENETTVTYRLTLTNFEESFMRIGKSYKEWSGNLTLKIDGRGQSTGSYTKNVLVDSYGNQSMGQTDESGTWLDITFADETKSIANTSGKLFADVIKPQFTYVYAEGDINQDDKQVKIVFSATDKYFATASLTAEDLTVLVDGELPGDTNGDGTIGTGETLAITKTLTSENITATVDGATRNIGKTYTLIIKDIEKSEIATGKNYLDYSGIFTLSIPAGETSVDEDDNTILTKGVMDESGNLNANTTITVGVDLNSSSATPSTEAEIADVVDPIWTLGDVSLGDGTIKLRATDKYFDSVLYNVTDLVNKITVQFNGSEAEGITKNLTGPVALTETRTVNGENVTVQYGAEYTLTISGLSGGFYQEFTPTNTTIVGGTAKYGDNSGNITIVIEGNTIKDQYGNINEDATTFNAGSVDMLSPEIFEVQSSRDTNAKTETIIFNVTDKSFYDDTTNKITEDEITVYIDGEAVTAIAKPETTEEQENNRDKIWMDLSYVSLETYVDEATETSVVGHQYTLVLSNFEQLTRNSDDYKDWSGTVSIKIAGGAVKDTSNATNSEKTITGDFVDFIKPDIEYIYSASSQDQDPQGDINYNDKTFTMVFDITDKYFANSTLASADDLTILIDGEEPEWRTAGGTTGVSKNLDKEPIYLPVGTKITNTSGNVVAATENSHQIGYKYTLTLSNLEQLQLESGNPYLDYSGVITVEMDASEVTDRGTNGDGTNANGNVDTTITSGVDIKAGTTSDITQAVVVDVVDPLWTPENVVKTLDVTTGNMTVTMDLIGTDKYYVSNSLSAGGISVLIGETAQTANVSITAGPEDVTDPTNSEKVVGVKYSLSITGTASLGDQLKVRIPQGTLTDESGNVSEVTDIPLDFTESAIGSLSMKLGSITGSDYTNNTWTKQDVYVYANASTAENTTTTYSIDEGTAKASGSANSTRLTGTGTHTAKLIAVNSASDITTNIIYIIKIDQTVPTLTSTNTAGGVTYTGDWTNKDVITVIDFSDNHSGINASSLAWSEDGTTWNTMSNSSTSTFTYTWTDERESTIYYKIIDNVGNQSTVSFDVKIDKTIPTLTVTPTSKSWTNTAVNVTITATDSVSNGISSGLVSNNIEYYLSSSTSVPEGATWTTKASGSVVTLDPGVSGEYYLFVKKVSDNAGNATTTDDYHMYGAYQFDYDKPTITVTPNTKTWTNTAVDVTITAEDTGGSELLLSNSYQWYLSNSSTDLTTGSWAGDAWTTYATGGDTITLNPGTDGEYYLFIKVIGDNAGNVSGTGSYHILGPYQFDYTNPTWSTENISIGSGQVTVDIVGIDPLNNGVRSGYASNSLIADKITVYVDDETATVSKSLSTVSTVTGGIKYTLTLSGFEQTTRNANGYKDWSGTVSIKIDDGTLTDVAGNTNVEGTTKYTLGFADFINPDLKYTHQSTDISTGSKKYTMTFDITDKYYTSGQLTLDNLTIKMQNGQKDASGNAIIHDLKSKLSTGSISLETPTPIYLPTGTKVTDTSSGNVVTVAANSYQIGHTYTLIISNLEQLEIASGLTTADYSGVITVAVDGDIIADKSGNKNVDTTITSGVDIVAGTTPDLNDAVAVDVVSPIWTKVSSSANAIDQTATVTFKGTDTYFKESILTNENVSSYIEVYVNGSKVTSGITMTLSAATPLEEERLVNNGITGSGTTTVQYGVQYTLTLSGTAFDQNANQVKIKILSGTLKDETTDADGNTYSNVNKDTEMILYNCLELTSSETAADSNFLGNSNIDRQDIEKIIFKSSVADAPTIDENICWDASAQNDKSILAWRTTSAPYTVYIGSNWEIFANQNSSYLFAHIGYGSSCTTTTGLITDLNSLNTNSVLNMSYMFNNFGHSKMTALDLGSFDTTNVTNMASMFAGCGNTAMQTLDLGTGFDTSNVTDFSNMFNGCGQNAMTAFAIGATINTIDFNITTDTTKTVNMSGMFQNFGQKLTSLTLGTNFNTVRVTDMSNMFNGCGQTSMTIFSLGSNFNTTNVENMSGMFQNFAYILETLSLGNYFYTSNVTNFSNMFNGCGQTSMKTLALGNNFNITTDTSKTVNMSGMFQDFAKSSTQMTSLDLGDVFYTTRVTDMSNMFSGCGTAGMTTLDLGPAFTKIASTNTDMFTSCGKSGLVVYTPEAIYGSWTSFKN